MNNNNNEICNPKVEVSEGLALNDKDYLNCLLSSLKELEKNYTVALTEASNEHLYRIYKNIFDSIASLQRDTFELAFTKGWYKLEKAEDKKIDKEYQCLNKDYTGLSI